MAVAREACKKHHDGELKYYKTMAIYVKEQLDQKLGNSWHICVGKLQPSEAAFQILNSLTNLLTVFATLIYIQALISVASALTRRKRSIFSGWNILASWCGSTVEGEVRERLR